MLIQSTMVFDSSSDGSIKTNSYGSGFRVLFKPSLFIPSEATNCSVSLISAKVWNKIPNISVELNNNNFRFQDNVGIWHVIVFADGLYDFSALKTTLSIKLTALGLASDYITMTADFANDFVTIFIDDIRTIDWTNNGGNNTFRELLGFGDATQDAIFSTTSSTIGITGLESGNLSTIDGVEIHSSLSKSLKNGDTTDILDAFPLNIGPSFLYYYQPTNPLVTQADHLVGTETTEASFSLTDNNDNLLKTKENWGFTVLLSYHMPETHWTPVKIVDSKNDPLDVVIRNRHTTQIFQ